MITRDDADTSNAAWAVRAAVRRSFIGAVLFAGIVALAVFGFGRLPTGFVPQEDEGYCILLFQKEQDQANDPFAAWFGPEKL